MNRGKFESEINTAWAILDLLELQGDRIWFPNYPDHPASYFRDLSYFDNWVKSFAQNFYNFSLDDNSLFRFHLYESDPILVSYSYLECPVQALSYSEFLLDEYGADIREVGEIFKEDYEQYLQTANQKETVTPIRYDHNPGQYEQGRHPASHFHFGFSNDIRVGSHKILHPLSFFLFVIRLHYPDDWVTLISFDDAQIWCRKIRDDIPDIDDEYFNELDEWELMLA